MRILTALRDRRIVQIVVSYAAAGWVALEVVDQLVDRGLAGDLVYLVALVWFVGGLAAATISGWFHGEKGHQVFSRVELVLLTLVGLLTLGATGVTVVRHRSQQRVAAAQEAAGSLDARRVAVLYLEDGSGDGELEFLADGLTESLIAELRAVGGLDVVSSNGVAPYRSSDLDGDSVARILEAGTYVQGRVDQRGDRYRVDIGLYDAESGAEIEAGSFTSPLSEALSLREGLTEQVSQLLRTWLGEEVRVRSSRDDATNDAAWVLTQRAERYRKNANAAVFDDDMDGAYAAFDVADSLLAAATELAPEWAGPHVGRARLAYELSRLEHDPGEADVLMGEAHAFADEALQLDPRDADALELRGTVRYVRWLLALEPDPAAADRLLESAEKDLRDATTVEPLQANAWNVLGHLYYQMDDIVEANLAARRAYEADAFLTAAPDILWRLWSTSYDLENRAQSRQWCDEGRARFSDNPRFFECELWNMTSGAVEPDPTDAWSLSDSVLVRTPEIDRELTRLNMQILVAGALAKAASKQEDDVLADSARAVLERSLGDTEVDPTREIMMTQAFVRTLLGDTPEAVDLLQQYLTFNPERREGFEEHGHWWWRDLRRDPAFQRMIGS